MTNMAIRATHLAKSYPIQGRRRRFDTLRDRVVDGFRGGWRRVAGDERLFWALSDVSFDVEHGEVVGIVGRNGAGKSTLLKILSRITRPTQGSATIRGRMSALLEVGTGFHPELSGRENIFVNGAILGMGRAEIKRKLDEIVAFAEVERFLEVPVKRYSSGMYVRLAFAVAAHLGAKVLVIDEVLAVGDVAFQRKCLGKIGDFARSGRTVLFVSHNIGTIQALCPRVIFLKDGRVEADDSTPVAIGAYLRSIEETASIDLSERTDRRGLGESRLRRVRVDGAGPPVTGGPLRLEFEFDRFLPGLNCSFTIYDRDGLPIAAFDSAIHAPGDSLDPGTGPSFICEVDELPLLPGRYRLNVAAMTGQDMQDHVEGAAVFEVEQGVMRGRPETSHPGYGSVCIAHRWRSAGQSSRPSSPDVTTNRGERRGEWSA
jgi:lipopolysaccharide transport system ATP-binding protein